MHIMGKVPSSNIIDFKLIEKEKCPSTAREMDSKRLIDVVRIRLADGCPMLIENTFLPVSLCPNLSWEMPGDPAFLIKRVTWDDHGRMVEYTKSITASARSKLEITMYPNGVQAERITV